jgi:MFS family permease
MLSYTTGKHGRGFVYAVNTAMDETGATIGPLVIAFVIARKADFRTAYAVLFGSAFLAISTAVGVFASLAFGKAFDRWGLPVVLVAVSLSAMFAPLVFLGSFWIVLVGLVLWGIGFATQDTLLKAVVAGMLPEGRRSFAFGLFYAGYGVGWLVGSTVTGLLYEVSIPAIIAFSIIAQLAALGMFTVARTAQPA